MSLTEFTVRLNVSVAIAPLASSTCTVIVVTPDALAAGDSVIVRFAPLPPSEMLPLGTSAVLLEVAVTVKLPAAVSASPTVKGIALVGVSSFVS